MNAGAATERQNPIQKRKFKRKAGLRLGGAAGARTG